MDYLSKTMPIYTCEEGETIHFFQRDEVEFDDDMGEAVTKVYGEYKVVKATKERPARWWTVGVYETSRAYGGPEEGGWYYTAGTMVEKGRMRFFDSYKKAKAYEKRLWDWVEAENRKNKYCEERLAVRCTTETMPPMYFPQRRPHYS